jgi:hypothetical protein
MFDTLQEVVDFEISSAKNRIIYETFERNVLTNPLLYASFIYSDGFGEVAFSWNWKLLVDDMPNHFNFLEIGVYKGRVLSQIGLLTKISNKRSNIYGITPLSTVGDKYSDYVNCDYLNEINANFKRLNGSTDSLTILNGFSQEHRILNIVKDMQQFDIIFIDGCHDYEYVCSDIKNYIPYLKVGGYLVLDDASLYIDNPHGMFLGHPDVGKAINDTIPAFKNIKELYAVGHNRVWKKLY